MEEAQVSVLQHFLMEGAANYGGAAEGDLAPDALAAAADLDYVKLVLSGVTPAASGATSRESARELVQGAVMQCVALVRAALAGPPPLVKDVLDRHTGAGGIVSVIEALAADPSVGNDDLRFASIALRADLAQARR